MKKNHLIILIAVLMIVLALAGNSYARKYNHIRTGALCYSLTDVIGADFVGRHYDVAINPSGANFTAVKAADPETKCLLYITMSSLRGGDHDLIQQFCDERGYNSDLMYLWAENDVCLASIAPSGSPCTGAITCTDSGERLSVCGWNSYRNQPDFTYPGMWEYYWYKYKIKMGSQYDGVYEDECTFYYHPIWDYYSPMMCFPMKPDKWTQGSASDIRGWEGYSHNAIRDSLLHLKQNQWLPSLMDSMRANNKQRFANPAAYGICGSDVIDDVVLTGTGISLGEGMHLRPTYKQFHQAAWDVMDFIKGSDGKAIVWTEVMAADSSSLGSWPRCLMERLGWFYMKGDTANYIFLVTGNEVWLRHNDYQAKDSLYKWLKAFEFDIGQPLGDMYTAQSGTDGAGQYYTLRARDFQNAIVLYRGASGSNYGDQSAIVYDLNGDYRLLQYDGSLGDIVTSASIRNCETVICVPDSTIPQQFNVDIDMWPVQLGILYDGWIKNLNIDTTTADVTVYLDTPDSSFVILKRTVKDMAPETEGTSRHWRSIDANPGDSYRFRAYCWNGGMVTDSSAFSIGVEKEF